MNFQNVAGSQSLQRLSCLQRRQRTFKPGEIEFGRGHGLNMAKRRRIVNGRRAG